MMVNFKAPSHLLFLLRFLVARGGGEGEGSGQPPPPPTFLQDKFCNPFKTEEGVGA